MIDLIFQAIGTGLFLSILVGPVFFLLLETSIRRGVRAALAFDIGVFISDLIYIAIASIFVTQIKKFNEGENAYLFQLIGGFIFLVFGLVTLFKKPKASTGDEAESINLTKDYVMLALKGFLLNFVNPAVIFYWFGVIAAGPSKDSSDPSALGDSYMLLYMAILLVTFFAVDVLKIIGAKKLRPLITDKVLTGLNRLTGLIFLVTGIILFARGVIHVVNHV